MKPRRRRMRHSSPRREFLDQLANRIRARTCGAAASAGIVCGGRATGSGTAADLVPAHVLAAVSAARVAVDGALTILDSEAPDLWDAITFSKCSLRL